MPDIIFAFDKKTARSRDADGRMRVRDCILSTAEINPYRGREIPKNDELGLEPNKVYDLYRAPDELKKAASTFEGVPLMIKHIPQTAEAPRKEYQAGAVHSITFDGEHLRGDLLVSDGMAIELIESGELADLSCGYRYKPVMRSGDAGGQHYDGVMTEIQGNHVALVDDGRASGAHVADSALRSESDQSMNGDSKMAFPNENEKPAGGEEQPNAGGAPDAGAPAEGAAPPAAAAPAAGAAPAPGNAAGEQNEQMNMAAIGQALKHIAAILQDIHGKVGGAAAAPAAGAMDSETGENDEIVQNGEAADMELQPAVAGDSEGGAPEMNAGGGDNPSLPAPNQDGTGARGNATPYGAMDARTVKTVQSAVDAALKRERARVSALNEACRDVRGVLGDVYGMDSAGDVYRAALEVKGVTGVAKGAEKAAWQGYISGAAGARGARTKVEMALDSDTVKQNQSSVLTHLAKISVKG
jgi:hypothetical protein